MCGCWLIVSHSLAGLWGFGEKKPAKRQTAEVSASLRVKDFGGKRDMAHSGRVGAE